MAFCGPALYFISCSFYFLLSIAIGPTIQESLPVNCGLRKTDYKFPTGRITGGREAQAGEFPWMVALIGNNGKLFCGGSLITSDSVLTAAHCFASLPPGNLKRVAVHVGDYNIKSTTEREPHEIRQVQKVLLHKGFDPKTYKDDIALLKLNRPVNFTKHIQPICAPHGTSCVHKKNVEGDTVVVAGWGQVTNGIFGSTANILRKVEIPVWKYAECKKIYDIFARGRLVTTQLCAGDGKRNRDACIGDSGGPLMFHSGSVWYQVGIVSWGKGCGSFPGVYTDIRKYTGWILHQLE